MSTRFLRLVLLAVLAASLMRSGYAQEGAKQEEPKAASSSDDEKEPQPANQPGENVEKLSDNGNSPLFYLLSRDGQLVLSSNITFEDIQEFFDLKQGLRQQNQAPKYAIQQTDVRAVVAGKVADLTIRVDFEVTGESESPIAVPLNFGGLIRPQFQYRGEGKQFVVYDGTSYVCWISAKVGSKHQITIKAISPVSRNADMRRLALSLPYAPSRTQLDVPVAKAMISVSDQRSSVSQRKPSGRRTQATIDSRGGDLEIRWSPQVAARSVAPLIFANTALNVRIENPQLLRVDAEIEVRAGRGELTEFDVRLPKGIKLNQRRPTGYTLADPAAADDGNGQVVRVRLDTPAQRAPRIRLSGEITRTPAEVDKPLEVWGFEVVGANQTGEIELLTGDEWVVTPMAGENIRRDRTPPDGPRGSTSSSRFTVVNQPCSLKIAVRTKQVRVVVDPTYHLDVSPTSTQLELRLLCRFGNGRPLDLELPLEGWSIRELLPERLTGAEGEMEMRDGKLTIALGKLTDAPMGDTEVIIRAERAHDEGQPLELTLPAPEVSEFSPGLALVVREPLVVAAASNNVELTPNLTKMPNVTSENVDQDALPEQWRSRQQAPIAFRADSAPLSFHATYDVRPRSVVATPAVTMDFGSSMAAVTQTLRFEVLFEPLSSIRIAAPSRVVESGDFEIRFGNVVLSPEDADDSGFTVTLPESQLGEFDLTFSYALKLPEVRASEDASLLAQILSPVGGEFIAGAPTLRCLCPDDLQVQLGAEEGWTETSRASRASDKLEQLYKASVSTGSISLKIRSAEVVSGSITVERMWVQTWLTQTGRRERAVFQVATPGDTLALTLPEDASIDDAIVAADGFKISELQIDGQRLQFQLPDAAAKAHLIEVWYQFENPRSGIGTMDIGMPAVVSARRVDQFYWELITPRREHLFIHPTTLTSEMQWRRRGLTYGREALLSSQQLAALFGASATVIPGDANRYLFSALGPTERIQAQTIRRTWLVILAAGVVMLLGAAWLGLQGGSRSLFFLAVAVAIGALATVYPNPALVFAQAGFVGLAGVTFARLLRWAFWSRRSVGVEIRGTASPTATAAAAPDSRSAVSQPSTTRVQMPSESGA